MPSRYLIGSISYIACILLLPVCLTLPECKVCSRTTALEVPDLPCTYLAHHELESVQFIVRLLLLLLLLSLSLFCCLTFVIVLINAGYGLDWIWPFLLGYPQERIAVIDEVCVIHPRKVLQQRGKVSMYEVKPTFKGWELAEEKDQFAKFGYSAKVDILQQHVG